MIIPPRLRRGATKLSAAPGVATCFDILDVTNNAVPIEVGLDCAASGCAQPPAQCGVSKQTVESLGYRRGAVGIDQESRFAVAYSVDQTSLTPRHHGDARRRGLHRGDTEALDEQVVASRNECEYVGGIVERRQICFWNESEKPHRIVQLQLRHQAFEIRSAVSQAADRVTHIRS